MTRLGQSVAAVTELLARGDLAGESTVRELLEATTARRRLDLSDLAPGVQAAMIAARCQQLQPGEDALAERITSATGAGRRFVAKLGIDPTGREIHLGHAVPMLLLSRFQRMGHEIVFIVGDVTAKIGDPSGRSDGRPPLSDGEIAANLATYRQQVSPFFDFTRAQFRFNGDWLREVTLPRLIEITSRIPVSMPLQREDFRQRLDSGQGLSLAELLYSVAMALDSVETRCDLEVGGIDQYLNMQMCRKVMEICGQAPELVAATALIEGTDGTGVKMSKSRNNYVPLTAPADEVFGRLMSVPDRLVRPYLEALSEWSDTELDVLEARLSAGSLRPLDAKRALAGEVAAALHGVDAAMKARDAFAARFSQRRYGDLELPVVPAASTAASLTEIVRGLGFAPSNKEVRRVAEQGGLRLVVESGDGQRQLALGPEDLPAPLAAIVATRLGGPVSGPVFLRFGRKLARIEAAPPGAPTPV